MSTLAKKKRVITLNSDLKPLTLDQYQSEIRKSIDHYKSGLVVNQKEMEKSIRETVS
jgi:hypothetical protein